MILSKKFNKKSFAIYGTGITGKSVIKFLKRSHVSNYLTWDDKNRFKKESSKKFMNFLDSVDFIVLSPGINIDQAKFKKKLKKNRKKIITDLDLFYMSNKIPKTVMITGTNGKSTTCKILEHLLKKNKFKVNLGGNIGYPILNLKQKKNSISIIEASSFQLSYSRFIKPNYAAILNLTKDHLDWHGSYTNYLNSKFKIFNLQDKSCFAFMTQNNLIAIYKKKKFEGKLKIYNLRPYLNIKNQINNIYLKSSANDQNLSFVYAISKLFNIRKKNFIKCLSNFKGLPHRQEFFLKFKNIKFVNDSKATSFEATKHALNNYKNIFWILGGLPKKGDKFKLKDVKKNILESFVIGKSSPFFIKQLKSSKLNYSVSHNLNKAIKLIFRRIFFKSNIQKTVLLSPASASYDQFKNFMDRGNKYKRLVNNHVRKFN